MTFFSNFGKLIVAFVVAVALIVGAWYGYWTWIAPKSVANQYNVNVHSQSYQAGLVSQLEDKVAGYDLATDPAQKANFAQFICSRYVDLTQPPQDLIEAHARICN